MAKNFASIAFTDQIKAQQEKHGSRTSYDRMEKRTLVDGLTEYEVDFIGKRDSFYIASIGENGYPYIQHRGGPKGFLKVFDNNTLGFVDYSGNKQYITVGNLATHENVSLFLMDYPARARLKVYAKAQIVELNAKPNLLKLLTIEDYAAKPERMMLLHIEAYDWNCSQHIQPRFTVDEIETALAPQREYIKKLEENIQELKARLDAH